MTSDCKVCEKPTEVVYNINLKAVFICESCARQISYQEINDLLLTARSEQEET